MTLVELKIFGVVGPATLRLSEGCIAEVNTAALAQAKVVHCDP